MTSKTIGIGRYGSKLQVSVTLKSQNLAANTSVVSVVVKAYNGGGSRTYNQGSGATVAVSGDASHSESKTFSIAGHSWGTFYSGTHTIKHSANGSKTASITAGISNTGTSALGNGGKATVKLALKRLVLAPSKPTWGTTKNVNESKVTVSWTPKASARGPYSSIQLQWHNGSKWASLATLSATAKSYTHTSIPQNRQIRYRVRAKGPGGTSGWTTGGTLGTKPAAASSVTARKSGSGIVLNWKDNASATGRTRRFYIDDAPDGGSWVRVGEVGGNATSWSHANPDPSKTHQYRIWTRITSQIDLTSSASSASNTVQLQAAPKQPTRVYPLDSDVLIAGEPVTMRWRHNPVDTTGQTEAALKWRPAPGAVDETVEGSASSLTVTPDLEGAARGEFGWNGRTRGEHPDFSPVARGEGILISTPPTVVIQEPEDGGTLDMSRAVLAWEYEPGGDESQLQQAEWSATLARLDPDSGAPVVIETKDGEGDTRGVQLDSRLENGTEYTVTLKVRNGDGLWSEADTASFTTDFPVPPVLEVIPEWNHTDGSVSLMLADLTEDDLNVSYRWTGEPHESTSERVLDDEVVRTNLAENPSFETGKEQPGFSTSDSRNATSDLDGEWSLTGTQSVRIDPVDDGNTDSTFYVLGSNLDAAELIAARFGLTPGETFTIGASIHLTQQQTGSLNSHARSIRINTVNSEDGISYSWALSPAAPNEPGTHRVVVTFTVPDDADVGITICLCNGSNTVPVWWDGLTIERGVTPGTYFDGDTPLPTDVVWGDVERREADGEWVLIGSGLQTGTSIVDRTPRLGTVEYRAISRTTLPTETTGEVVTAEWVHEHCPTYVTGGDGMTMVCTLRGGEVSDDYGIEQASHQFAGRSRPTPFFGDAETLEVSASGRILHVPDMHEASTREDWVDLLHEFGVVCLRDCRGRKVFGLLNVDFSTKTVTESVTVKVEQTEWDESVERVSDADLEAMLDSDEEGDE